ncbi:MAG: hypothetical protein KGM99_05600 [Burkholderiales bacterium]|nr:hypothetical protein [Burkholderiales bacterium]
MEQSLVISWLPDPENHPLWDDIKALLQTAADRGGFRVWDDGDLVWLAIDNGVVIGAATTRHLNNGNTELMHVAGTRFKEWVPEMESIICEWSRKLGANAVQSRGRSGWQRLNKSWGWEVIGKRDGLTLYEKEL